MCKVSGKKTVSKNKALDFFKSHKVFSILLIVLVVVAIACAIAIPCYKSYSQKKEEPTTKNHVVADDLVCHTFIKTDDKGTEEKYEYYCHGDEVVNIKQYATTNTSKQTKEYNDELIQLVKSRQEIYPEFSDFIKYTYKISNDYVVETIELTNVSDHMFELMQIGMIDDPEGTMTYISLKQVTEELEEFGFKKQ